MVAQGVGGNVHALAEVDANGEGISAVVLGGEVPEFARYGRLLPLPQRHAGIGDQAHPDRGVLNRVCGLQGPPVAARSASRFVGTLLLLPR